MDRAGYIIILFRNLYAYTYICTHAMIIKERTGHELEREKEKFMGELMKRRNKKPNVI